MADHFADSVSSQLLMKLTKKWLTDAVLYCLKESEIVNFDD